jgi:hypothetical protein
MKSPPITKKAQTPSPKSKESQTPPPKSKEATTTTTATTATTTNNDINNNDINNNNNSNNNNNNNNNNGSSSSDGNNNNSDTRTTKDSSLCKVCGNTATIAKKKNERNVLGCHECSGLIHFSCTRAPPYILYSYSTTGKRFTCETCANVPASFTQHTPAIEVPTSRTVPEPEEKRMDIIEGKIDSIMDLLQKYDIPSIADVVQSASVNLTKLGNECRDHCSNLTKKMEKIEELPTPEIVMNNNGNQEKRIETLEKETNALRSSERLLMDTIKEKDSEISTLRDVKERHITAMNERNTEIQTLKTQLVANKKQNQYDRHSPINGIPLYRVFFLLRRTLNYP